MALTDALARRLRMKLMIPPAIMPMLPVLERWLAEIVPEFDTELDAELSVRLEWTGQWLVWQAVHRFDVLQPTWGAFLRKLGLAEQYVPYIEWATAQLQPALIGVWIKAIPTGIDMGWFIPGVLSLEKVRPLMAELPAAPLFDWAAAAGVQKAWRWGCSITQRSTFAEVQLPLPGQTIAAQLAAYRVVCELFEISPLPETIQEVFVRQENEVPLVLNAAFLADGLMRLGVHLAEPDMPDLMLLSDTLNTGVSLVDLAELEGTLGVSEREMAECMRLSTGIHLEVEYLLQAEE